MACLLVMVAAGLGVLSRPTWQEAAAIRELVRVLYLYGHWHAAVVRYASLASFRLRSASLRSSFVQRWQVLSVLDNHWRFHVASVAVATYFLRKNIIILLVLNLLLLL